MKPRCGRVWLTALLILVAVAVACGVVGAIIVIKDRNREAEVAAANKANRPLPPLPPEVLDRMGVVPGGKGGVGARLRPLHFIVPDDIPVIGPPIPQDPERIAARRQRIHDRLQRQVVAAYEEHGKKDPRWDDSARAALRAAVDLWSAGETAVHAQARKTAALSARAAVKSGCTDALVRYLALRFAYDYENLLNARAEADRMAYRALLADMRASAYPPARKGGTFVNAAASLTGAQIDSDLLAEINGLLDETLLQAAALLDEGGDLARNDAYHLCQAVVEVGRTTAHDRQVWYQRTAATLGDRPGADVVRNLLLGDLYVKYAWEARGAGWANTVTDEGHRLYRERLEKAEDAYQKAWSADSSCVKAAAEMILVCQGLGHSRETMEKWFRRALEVDGDCLDACEKKLHYLLPKWCGSVAETVSFGRQCRDTNNWTGSLPIALAHVHRLLAADSGNKYAYLRLPVVRADIESVYRPLLKEYPDALAARTNFFQLAFENDWHDIAREQAKLLGDEPWLPLFHSVIDFMSNRDQALDPRQPGATPTSP